MNVLLTGGSGFIGKNITESFLAEKYNILPPPHSKLDLLEQDSVDEYFDKNRIDLIIHCACKPGHRNAKNTEDVFYCNTKMFDNLLNNRTKWKKMIMLGSGAVYDCRNYQPKMSEEYCGKNIPVDEHGLSRYTIAKQAEAFDNIYELRLFGVFGKYEDWHIRFISNAICKTLFDLPITIKQNRKFDYIYIDDLMSILDYFIQNNPKNKVFNVTPDCSIELLELAGIVNKIAGKNLPVKISQSGLGLEYSGENTLLKKEIKDLTLTPVNQAIGELFQWYASQKKKINAELLMVDK
jgi:UDP-glucose 4-epimerase